MNSKQSDSRKRKVAIIDVGSNSIKLLVASRGLAKRTEIDLFAGEETRLGEGIAGSPPYIDPKAIEKGLSAIAALWGKAKQHRPSATCIVATSAVREAINKEAFAAKVAEATGHPLTILSGDREAELVGRGLIQDPKLKGLQNFWAIDLGGGSLEIIRFIDGDLEMAQSLDLGCVRLTSRFVEDRGRALDNETIGLVEDHIMEALSCLRFSKERNDSKIAILTGGSASVFNSFFTMEEQIEGIPLEGVSSFCETVCGQTLGSRIEKSNIPISRADVFPAAMLAFKSVLQHLQSRRIFFSQYNLRFGVAQVLLDKGVI